MRKICYSSKCTSSIVFSARAVARSWPNGFSMISRVQPVARPPLAERLDDRSGTRHGGTAQVVDAVAAELAAPRRAASARSASAVLVRRRRRSPSGRSAAPRRTRPTRPARNSSRACFAHRLLHVGAEALVVAFAPRDADDGEPRREQPPQHQRVERRHQLLVREVARRAEDDERARIRRAPERQPLLQRVLLFRHGRHQSAVFTAWPPNSLRSAAMIFAEKFCSSREAKRANSAAAITGVGTSSAIASWTVQRPSPESST